VVAVGTSPAATVAKSWTFGVVPLAKGELFNINFSGNTGARFDVPDGLVINAGSSGSNLWNNLVQAADIAATPASPVAITNANDGGSSIGLSWYGNDRFFSGSSGGPALTQLNRGYFGSGGASGTTRTIELSGLDTNITYDIYAYFTWRWNENAVTYTITEGTGATTNLVLTPEIDTAAAYESFVDGTGGAPGNYVVFTNLAPSAAGQIDIKADSNDGGFSALQVVAHSTGPGYPPFITSITVSGSNVSLSWTADHVGVYSIQRKTSLADTSWVDVLTGLPAGNQATNVTATGSVAEFYRIEGE
jgi:hypothetical protein